MEFKGFDKNFNITGKTVLITGAAAGIGKVIAKFMAEKGSNIVLMDKSDKVHDTAQMIKALGVGALAMVGDVTNVSDMDKIIKNGIETFGRIDILINNAAIVRLNDPENFTTDDWDNSMAVNLTAPFMFSQAVGKEMIKDGKGGKIINITSQAGIIALNKQVAYCVSKAGLIHMSKVLGFEWAKYGIQVNAVSPSFVFTDTSMENWGEELTETLRKLIPAGRFVYPMEIAATVAFLASEAADMITGANIVIDGGVTIQ